MRFSPGCVCCEAPCTEWCVFCTCNSPTQFEVIPAGVVDSASCTACDTGYNGVSFFLDQYSESPSLCKWQLVQSGPCLGGENNLWQLEITDVGSALRIELRMYRVVDGFPSVFTEVIWRQDISEPVECCADLNGLELLYYSNGANVACNYTSSTVTIYTDC